MSKDDQYMTGAKNILRGVLVTKGVSYTRLSELLNSDGIEESPRSVAAKVSRGKFSFAFFLRCMCVLGVDGGFFLIPKKEEMLSLDGAGLATKSHDLKKIEGTSKPPATRRPPKASTMPRTREADLTSSE
ncbi:DUF6471 domain-containing protein [Caballeronia grimmiae]|uniref:DUF6471 domain-containing protein n=1 Tax=Caballeronia grimmiae TaxID=1071679 RepID=UPI0038B77710